MRRPSRPRRTVPAAGFTLVELLVVIGIIALLIGILMPALTRARRSAIQVTCQSNLRQIGLAYHMYVNDNKGMLLPGELRWTTPAAPNYMFWYMALRPYVNKNLAASGNENRAVALWKCPADETRGGYASAGATLLPRYGGAQGGILPSQEAANSHEYLGRSYAVNGHGTSGWYRNRSGRNTWAKANEYWIRSNKVRRHAETIIVTDFDWWGGNTNSFWIKPPFAPFGASWAGWEEILVRTAKRHPNDNINSLFLDGHVTSIPLKDLRRDGKQERLWFRDYPNDWPGPGL